LELLHESGNAEVADMLLVVGRVDGDLAVACIPADSPKVSVAAMPALDATRKLYRVGLDGAGDRVLAQGEAARLALDRATRLATIAVCAELVGGIQWVLATSVEYARTREQFGRVIGSFQAVQHQCADMLYYLESARSIAYFAAWALSVDDAEGERAVAVANAYHPRGHGPEKAGLRRSRQDRTATRADRVQHLDHEHLRDRRVHRPAG
jgi:alkylation response protein AidB-like acyl-CoA dehydrogenase